MENPFGRDHEPMTLEDQVNIAQRTAQQREDEEAAPTTDTGAHNESPLTNTNAEVGLKPPPFLHRREISDAIRVVSQIASGRNPFSEEPFERLRPEQRDSVLQALCVIVSTLAVAGHLPPRAAEVMEPAADTPREAADSKPPVVDTADPSSKRPLEPYLDRVEREAILEALAESHFNVTATAKMLGITFRALRYRMERLRVDRWGEVD